MSGEAVLIDGLLPDLDRERILACYRASPGNEVDSGKFASRESSACLAANTFGFFLDRPEDFPPLPGLDLSGPITSIAIEKSLRFPWAGGRHPWLDAVIETQSELVGIESKRYEPYRARTAGGFAEAYMRPVWGDRMRGYEAIRDGTRSGASAWRHLDTAQLVKHALGLLTQAGSRRPVLVYLYAAPRGWPDGRLVGQAMHEAHRAEIARFAETVRGDVVAFAAVPYGGLLDAMAGSPKAAVRVHARAIGAVFDLR